jgi:hypothetical protein
MPTGRTEVTVPFSYRVRHLPHHQPLTLLAQVGARSCAAWQVVGTVVVTPAGLEPTFSGHAVVCQPAWQACCEGVPVGTEGACRFAVRTDAGVVVIGEAPVSSRVVQESRCLADQVSGLTPRELRAQREEEARWRTFFRGRSRRW